MIATTEPLPGTTPTKPQNYFAKPAAALRYAKGRPTAHPQVLPLLLSTLSDSLPVEHALDVGCGTGNSTIALLPYAKWVVGLDSASAMIAQAPLHPRVDYRKGYAEALPFRAASFDLVTVCSAYHWFDHERFLAEAARVLKARGWLALYKIGSMGHALDNSSFASWKKDIFRSRFPKVARNDAAMDEATAQQFGFEPCACEQLRFAETYTLERYLDNLLTHSSVIRVVDSGAGQLAQTRSWLRDQLSAFFGAGELTFEHEASIHILRKI